jgi:hypothetical protein
MTRHRPPRRALAAALALGLCALPAPALSQAALPAPASAAPPAPSAPASAAPPAPASAAPPAPSAPASAAPPAPGVEAAKEAARVHFDKGLRLLEERAFDGALAEFQLSRRLFPTRSATENAAICLRELHRFDEALETYEALVRDYPDLPADVKARVDKATAELRGLVGTLEVRAAEPGATVSVDSRDRGATPLKAPLRVSAGTHTVRVYKPGFAPFETRFEIAGGETVAIQPRLDALPRAGRLRVTEPSGHVVDVVIDNAVVGKTPWEGALAPGDHTVLLRGAWNDGSPPTLAHVELDRTTELRLADEELAGALRVVPDPPDATVSIDGVPVGRGTWDGRLVAGEHEVVVAASGFAGLERRVVLDGRRQTTLGAKLVPEAAAREASGHLFVEVSGAGAFSATFGADVAGGCKAPCDATLAGGEALSAAVGWETASGLGISLSAGTLRLVQQTASRAAQLVPVGKPANLGKLDDQLELRSAVLGIAGSYRVGHRRLPVLFRLGAGALLGGLTDTRGGTFRSSKGTSYDPGILQDNPAARYLHVTPEVRGGVRLTEHLSVEAGIQAMFLFAVSQPRWTNERPLLAADDGLTSYAEEALAAKVLFVLLPGAGVRYEF